MEPPRHRVKISKYIEFYTFNAGVFVKNDGKQYYKTIESNLGELAKLKKQYNTDL